MDDLKCSMDRALKNGFAEKMARRYRMPWRLCDYHIARTLGVKGLTPPRFGSVAWKKGCCNSPIDGANRGNIVEPRKQQLDLVAEDNVTNEGTEGIETADKSVIVKLEDKKEEERRSAHYLITDYWNNMEGFFGSLETVQDRSNRDFTRPVVPLPRKIWQLKSEPMTQEPMWTYATPQPSVIVCKQEQDTNNFNGGTPTNQNETNT